MRYGGRFYIECVKHAWRSSIEHANTAGALFGGLILLFILQCSPDLKDLGDMEAPTTIFGTIVFTLGMLGVSVVLTWLVIFLVRVFLVAPVNLYAEAQRKIDALAKPQEAANPNLNVTITTITTHNHFYMGPNTAGSQVVGSFQPEGTQLNSQKSTVKFTVNPEPPNTNAVKIED
jgi:hypothetical protein